MSLSAKRVNGEIVIEDLEGRVWLPDEQALEQINNAEVPLREALRLCRIYPEAGKWITREAPVRER